MKKLMKVIAAGLLLLWLGILIESAQAQEFRFAVGGLTRDDQHQVAQLSASLPAFKQVYVGHTRWRESSATSVLYAWSGDYFEAGAGAAYVSGFKDDDRAGAHARIGVHGGPFFVSYEVIVTQNDRAGFLLGGVRFNYR